MLTAFLAIAATQILFVALLFGTLYLDRDGGSLRPGAVGSRAADGRGSAGPAPSH
jgi:hypothetical protein